MAGERPSEARQALAFAAALALRGSKTAQLAGIISYYPGVDFSHVASPSYEIFGDGSFGLSRDDTDWFRTVYAPNPAHRLDYRCSPALAVNVSGLPPTLIVAAAYDALRDDDLSFAKRLQNSGVEVSVRLVDGVNHGLMGVPTAPPPWLRPGVCQQVVCECQWWDLVSRCRISGVEASDPPMSHMVHHGRRRRRMREAARPSDE
jgi:acetyl esterase/lipase